MPVTVTASDGRSGAVFSDCMNYRYHLWRALPPDLLRPEPRGVCLFLMLNPSTADAEDNDPTVERCQVRATAWNFARLEVCNLFAFRSTDPRVLPSLPDPVGPLNTETILNAAINASLVVCAWGIPGRLKNRAADVVAGLRAHGVRLHALKFNDDGSPCHPLYLPYSLQPALWTPTERNHRNG